MGIRYKQARKELKAAKDTIQRLQQQSITTPTPIYNVSEDYQTSAASFFEDNQRLIIVGVVGLLLLIILKRKKIL